MSTTEDSKSREARRNCIRAKNGRQRIWLIFASTGSEGLKQINKNWDLVHYFIYCLYLSFIYIFFNVYISIFILEAKHMTLHETQTLYTGGTPDLRCLQDPRPTVLQDLDPLCRETHQCTSYWLVICLLRLYGHWPFII